MRGKEKIILSQKQKDFIRKQLENHVPVRLIAQDLGVCIVTALRMIIRHDLRPEPKHFTICHNVYLDKELHARLTEEAKEFGVSRAQITRMALEAFLLPQGDGEMVNAHGQGQGFRGVVDGSHRGQKDQVCI